MQEEASNSQQIGVLFKEAGGFGRFQLTVQFLVILGILSGSTILYNTWYFQMQPIYECKFPQEDSYRRCTNRDFCGNLEV